MTDHVLPSPYPMKIKTATVVNELCRCGALRTEHRDFEYNGVAMEFGHGKGPKDCPKFSWAGFVYGEDPNDFVGTDSNKL